MRARGRQRKLAAGLAALLVLAFVVWYALRPNLAPGEQPGTPTASHARQGQTLSFGRSHMPVRAVAHGGDAPIIEAIELEKQEACAGEENLITVRATADEGSALLRYLIAGVPGQRLAILGVPDDEHPGWSQPMTVQVFGRNGATTRGEVPPFRLLDCVAPHRLLVSAERRINTDSELQLTARVVPFGEGAPFQAVSYRWNFGGGQLVETSTPSVIHDFADRPQDTLYAYQLITVEAIDADGHTVAGRHTLELSNRYFENKTFAHTIVLRHSMSPRFAERDEQGVVRQKFRVWHHEAAPVRIERVVEQTNFLPAEPGGEAPPVRERTVAAISVLPVVDVPAAGVELELAIDTTQEPGVSFRSWRLEGRSAEGIPVDTVISLMPPSPDPTADHHIPVDDAALKARIERALALLHKSTVTGEELEQLEREGAFADLPAYRPAEAYVRTAIPATPRPR